MKDKNSKLVRANFIIDRNKWFLFKIMAGRHKIVENGKERQATGSDILRKLIDGWMIENQNLIPELLEEFKHLSVIPSVVRRNLEEQKSE